MRTNHSEMSDQELRFLDETILDAIDKVKKEKIPYKVFLSIKPFAAFAKFTEEIHSNDGTEVYCIIDYWDEKTILIRHSGGECEFIKVG